MPYKFDMRYQTKINDVVVRTI